jgi:hypothetical protein
VHSFSLPGPLGPLSSFASIWFPAPARFSRSLSRVRPAPPLRSVLATVASLPATSSSTAAACDFAIPGLILALVSFRA